MNWKGCGRWRLLPELVYNRDICLEGMR